MKVRESYPWKSLEKQGDFFVVEDGNIQKVSSAAQQEMLRRGRRGTQNHVIRVISNRHNSSLFVVLAFTFSTSEVDDWESQIAEYEGEVAFE